MVGVMVVMMMMMMVCDDDGDDHVHDLDDNRMQHVTLSSSEANVCTLPPLLPPSSSRPQASVCDMHT